MPETRVRVVGSGFTTLEYNGQPIAFLQSFQDSGQGPFGGQGFEPIMPLGSTHPVEIATGRVLAEGRITATIYELWNQPVWYQLSGLAGTRTITDVWAALRASASSVTCRMVIRPPNSPPRGKVYHGCVITAIPDNETVNIGAISVSKSITIVYTHTSGV